MRILFFAPMPPPITGHSIISKRLAEYINEHHDLRIIDIGRDSSSKGQITKKRIWEVLSLLMQAVRSRHFAERVYITISESLLGNIKDVVIYMCFWDNLKNIYIHLHGGSFGLLLQDGPLLLRTINKYFLKRIGGVIVCGQSHRNIFSGYVDPERLHVVDNFAQESLFVPHEAIEKKFTHHTPLRVLYASGMIPPKGYDALLEGYLSLPRSVQSIIRIDFAGDFDSKHERIKFQKKLRGVQNVRYHGMVKGTLKQALFAQAHIFCLPTSFLEGQPVALLEAYASGCVPLTTTPPGIRDIFDEGRQGFVLAEGSAEAVAEGLMKILSERSRLAFIAKVNRTAAEEQFRFETFSAKLSKLLTQNK